MPRWSPAALRQVDPPPESVVLIENVGNLVCPALFDLGETHRVLVASVTEGVDKPLMYPSMFRFADLVLLNKIDLRSHLDFELGVFQRRLRQINSRAALLPRSATRGDGLFDWYNWLRQRRRKRRPPRE